MNSRETSKAVEGSKCLNCAEMLAGSYCHNCGQKGGHAPLFVHDFVHFDAKIVVTLRTLLLSPGMLTREYIEGRRVRYVGPVRLYLVASVVLFGILALVPVYRSETASAEGAAALAEARAEAVPAGEHEATVVRDLVDRSTTNVTKAMQDPEHFVAALRQALSKTVFLLVPIFAFLTWRMFGKNLSFYVGHLYFALHLHAFIFILLSASAALSIAGSPFDSAGPVLGVAFTGYFFLALHRAFAATWLRTLAGGSVVLAVYLLLNCFGIAALTMGTLYYL